MGNRLKSLGREIVSVLKSDRDFIIAITGPTGEGKSTLAIQIAKNIDKRFDFQRNVAFSRKDFMDSIKANTPSSLPEYSVIVADEAINLLFSRQSMAGQQIELIKLLDMCRDRHLCLILCMPNFWSLDKHVRDNRVKAWVYIEHRAKASVFKPDLSPVSNDPWHRDDMIKKLKFWRAGMDFSKLKTHIWDMQFNDLSPTEKKLYLSAKAEKRAELEKEIHVKDTRFDKEKQFHRLLTLKQGKVPMDLIAKSEGLKVRSLQTYYSEMKTPVSNSTSQPLQIKNNTKRSVLYAEKGQIT